jgi:hypothetical protein
MDRQQKTALTLVLVGIILPLLLIPFLTNYKPEAGWWWNLMNIKVAFGTLIAVPYRFILAFSVLLIYLGAWRLDLLKR